MLRGFVVWLVLVVGVVGGEVVLVLVGELVAVVLRGREKNPVAPMGSGQRICKSGGKKKRKRKEGEKSCCLPYLFSSSAHFDLFSSF